MCLPSAVQGHPHAGRTHTCSFLSSPSRYWRYSEEMKTMDPGYPKPITVWKGVPDSPQGAFVHKENGTRAQASGGGVSPPCGPAPC